MGGRSRQDGVVSVIEPGERPSPRASALRIAVGYAAFGGLWILLSDQVVRRLAGSAGQLTVLQTVKGWLFILLSSAVIYGLVVSSHRRMTDTNQNIETAVHQVSILHRILRHNLRNVCSIIGGAIYGLEHDPASADEYLELLDRQNERLESLSRKSHYLREFLTDDASPSWVYDLVEMVASAVDAARRDHPHATVHVDLPETVPVRAHHLVGEAIGELVENAIEHNDADAPRVWLSVDRDDTWTTLTVEDDGPGIPESERAVLRRRFETSKEHSQGLGLWLVQLTVEESGGSLDIESGDRGGARIRLTVPTADL